jgi:hypothetical protein
MPSTVIVSFQYLAERRELEITFRTRRIYVYKPPEKARDEIRILKR